MARVAWTFDSYSWSINPDTDSDWVYEQVISEQVPVNASNSSIQFGGRKSGRRQIEGWLWGPNALTQKNKMKTWQLNRTRSTLTDHLGNAQAAILIRFEAKMVQSVSEWLSGRQTWRYTAEFIAV